MFKQRLFNFNEQVLKTKYSVMQVDHNSYINVKAQVEWSDGGQLVILVKVLT